MIYLIDSNVLIQSANTHYPIHIFPGFWSWLDTGIKEGWVRSVISVYHEIMFPDELKEWLDSRVVPFFVDESDIKIQNIYKNIAGWVNNKYEPEQASVFLKVADPWLIATAVEKGATVVTQEARVTPGAKKVKIPNVCEVFKVPCIDIFALLREKAPVL